MMDNLRRNVDDKTDYINYYNINELGNRRHDSDRGQAQYEQEMAAISAAVLSEEGHKVERTKMIKDLNELDTVTTVPQLQQQKFNKFNIIDEAAITTSNTSTTTAATISKTTTTCVAAAKPSTSTTTASSTSTHQQNTALAKFNRIIDNTMPVINVYNNYQQHVAETLAKSSQQQHPQHYHQQQQYVEMPLLSDSLKRRLAHQQHHYQSITDPIVNNSKINFSSSITTTTDATAAAISKANATATASNISSSSSLQQQKQEYEKQQQEQETFTTAYLIKGDDEVKELKRNDVHYLLKQLNSFSDIEEIEIVDMKQKQRLQQQKQQQKQQQLEEKLLFDKEKNYLNHQQQSMSFQEYQHVERMKQHVDIAETKFITSESITQTIQQEHVQHIACDSPTQTIIVGQQMCIDAESKQHYETISTKSPTATSLVIYSPSSQSHKGVRRYASQDEHAVGDSVSYQRAHPTPHHHHYHHHHYHPHNHHLHMPHEHCSESSILDSAAAHAAAGDPLILQQFVDDYMFQSCHYLETNNFVANYRTAMVESSSHEFRPSTTTTTTRTSNEEFYEEEEAGYVEDHSSAHSFELHETEPPTVICKAPAPAFMPHTKMKEQLPLPQQQLKQFAMETRLCSSGVQTDLTASSLAQSFSLSSSLSSSEKNKRKQPIFKCCYTPLDRWRERRSQQQQQQSQIQKRTKSATTTTAATASIINLAEQKQQRQQQHQQIITKNTSVAVVGGTSSNAGVGCSSATTSAITTTTIVDATSTSPSLFIVKPQHYQQHSQPQSLTKNKNAPYAV